MQRWTHTTTMIFRLVKPMKYDLKAIKRTNKKTINPPPYPVNIELAYARILRKYNQALAKYIWTTVVPAIKKTGRIIQDATLADLKTIIAALKKYATEQRQNARAEINKLLNSYAREHTKKWREIVAADMGVDVSTHTAAADLKEELDAARQSSWVAFKNYSEDLTVKVELIAIEYAKGGKSVAQLTEELIKRFGIARRRSKVIARDQVAKANSTFNQLRQREAGIERYRWSTSMDRRVRPTHRANRGRTFRWDTPPATTGHPGNDIMCRCSAIGVL